MRWTLTRKRKRRPAKNHLVENSHERARGDGSNYVYHGSKFKESPFLFQRKINSNHCRPTVDECFNLEDYQYVAFKEIVGAIFCHLCSGVRHTND